MQEKNRDRYGIAALVIGLVGFFLLIFLPGALIGLTAAIVATALATASINRIGKNPVARVGRILGIIGIIMAAMVIIYEIIVIIVMRVGA